MSATDTNLDTQKQRHKGPLVGIGLVLGLVAVGFVVFFSTQFLRGMRQKGLLCRSKAPLAHASRVNFE